MAKVVGHLPGRKTAEKYPWDKWLDGRVWRLDKGSDFTSSVEAMRGAARRAAVNRGKTITTRGRKDCLYIQVVADGDVLVPIRLAKKGRKVAADTARRLAAREDPGIRPG